MTVADGNNKSCESEGGDLLKTIKVYRPSMVSSLKAIADLPESSATTQEVAAAYSSQSSKREQLENAPMLTKRLRTERDAKEHEQKRQKFPQVRPAGPEPSPTAEFGLTRLALAGPLTYQVRGSNDGGNYNVVGQRVRRCIHFCYHSSS